MSFEDWGSSNKRAQTLKVGQFAVLDLTKSQEFETRYGLKKIAPSEGGIRIWLPDSFVKASDGWEKAILLRESDKNYRWKRITSGQGCKAFIREAEENGFENVDGQMSDTESDTEI